MKEIEYTIVPLSLEANPATTVELIEKEVKAKWDQGWIFVNAEPDALFESLRIKFERSVYV